MIETSELQLVNDRIKEKPKLGLKDCGHLYPTCSMCGKKLMDIWIQVNERVNPDQEYDWTAKASCPYCLRQGSQQYSYPVKFNGLFAPGGYGEPNKDKLYTKMKDIKQEGDCQVFIMEEVT